ncbi:amidohydrolase [Nocardioides insulae]|uniref:amidohydrolase n=1 Tax=Nocardioides insulae TaxID=394734 RepID=UPI00040A56B3|nr:amidohydrolase [Nocardioides insulae]
MSNLTDVGTIIDVLTPEFTALSDAIWDHPQLRWAEYDAVDRHIAVAEAHGATITREIGGIPTAFSAEWGTDGPVIAFLGEYDALAGLSQASGSTECAPDPDNTTGCGQGCGHHLLGAGALLAAVSAAKFLAEKNLPGRVRYYGCPAEEAAAGKSFMVKAGAFADVDATVTWHPNSRTFTRQTRTVAYAQMYFHYRGVASHAGAAPHRGRSALDAAELLNIGVNFLREHMPDSARIHYAFTDVGGESPNVVQEKSSIYYVVRAETVAEMRELYERVFDVARGAAQMTGTELSIEFDGASAEILPNDVLEEVLHRNVTELGPIPFDADDEARAKTFADTYEAKELASERALMGLPRGDTRVLADVVPPMDITQPRQLISGSTDVGDVSWVTPTVQIMTACMSMGTAPHSWQFVAQGKLPAAHKGMVYSAKAIAGTALDLFTDPNLLAQARKEFEETTAITPYDCPIPDGVIAPPLRNRA